MTTSSMVTGTAATKNVISHTKQHAVIVYSTRTWLVYRCAKTHAQMTEHYHRKLMLKVVKNKK